jgi:2-phosphosulfolactate phosphatase
MATLEVLFSPAEFTALMFRDLRRTTCVVFDVLRATSSMLTALGHGAKAIIPAASIEEALELRARHPGALLAGERDGVRILGHLARGVDFDLGNSPREFTSEQVAGRTIIITTTNGTRALQACADAQTVIIGAFLNLAALAARLRQEKPERLTLVCSGTYEAAAYEDTLCAGALCDQIWDSYAAGQIEDSAQIARELYRRERHDLPGAMQRARNGRRLLSRSELAADVAFCLQHDTLDVLAKMGSDQALRRWQ